MAEHAEPVAAHELHDATLVSVAIDWPNSSVVMRFQGPHSIEFELVAGGFTKLECPRQHPWGPSNSVNEFSHGAPSEVHGKTVRVEMQSGDAILLVAESIQLLRTRT